MTDIHRIAGQITDRVVLWTWDTLMYKTDLEVMKEDSYSASLRLAEDNTIFISGGWVRFINYTLIEKHCLN